MLNIIITLISSIIVVIINIMISKRNAKPLPKWRYTSRGEFLVIPVWEDPQHKERYLYCLLALLKIL